MKLTVCWKWVTVDGGEPDDRWAGVSPADEAALETALTVAAADDEVVVVSAGPPGAVAALRRALAAGATRAVRIDTDGAASRDVATAVAAIAAGSDYVLCGDYSLDRGTGSVPAFLAADLGAAQALGLVSVDVTRRPVRVVRRLDGGRREVLDVPAPAVLSVEGSVARLRRASLAASLASNSAPVDVVGGPPRSEQVAVVTAYRPRARSLPAPAGGTLTRVRDILDIGGEPVHSESVTLDPPAAARRIVDQLRDWGHLPA
ncbi:MAG: putative mycofactocin-associated electron transfer flavoprotein [Ilumatobacter sp.]|nr:putative mycofactocin-associated electron transfer flavoprotein [Ilumatobacter sp.]